MLADIFGPDGIIVLVVVVVVLFGGAADPQVRPQPRFGEERVREGAQGVQRPGKDGADATENRHPTSPDRRPAGDRPPTR